MKVPAHKTGCPLIHASYTPHHYTSRGRAISMEQVQSALRLIIVILTVSDGMAVGNRLPLSAQLTRMQSKIDVLRRDVDQLLSELHRSPMYSPAPINTIGDGYVYAHCRMVPNGIYNPDTYEPIVGDIDMRQRAVGGQMDVKVFLYGFSQPNSKHGLHIHTYGDLRNGCGSAGGHYNPGGNNHSAPYDSDRHMGDWGNVQADESGMVQTSFSDKEAVIVGKNTVIGRTIVIHIGEDDMGNGGKEDSKMTGNAGGRLGCCVIGLSDGKAWEDM
ncbi:superoxide dismutase [Cu-Zn]-like [Asterias rubens]|uniref:superoxide dismutase [Cu-Zn]-like n=1 Tax=Asterias rubens TaxID=7604 RepID=UPI001455B939|nr:superoxide dismutase [Cu-Zn]-like [Asterias rubens]